MISYKKSWLFLIFLAFPFCTLNAEPDKDKKQPINKLFLHIHNCDGAAMPQFIEASINGQPPVVFKVTAANKTFYECTESAPPFYDEIKSVRITDCGKFQIDNSSVKPRYLANTKEAVYEFSFLYELKVDCDIPNSFTVKNTVDNSYPEKKGIKVKCDTVKKKYVFIIETNFGSKRDGYPFKHEYKVSKHIDENKYAETLDEREVRKIILNTLREKEAVENIDIPTRQLHKISYHLELSEK
ncbi:MAG: hypothetical protein K0Q79_982 [Flavipsychrobacter sp.]|jgi:hypothetical protein|nr:hypothetical protein [Flavipsychrobacter sp.]